MANEKLKINYTTQK